MSNTEKINSRSSFWSNLRNIHVQPQICCEVFRNCNCYDNFSANVSKFPVHCNLVLQTNVCLENKSKAFSLKWEW